MKLPFASLSNRARAIPARKSSSCKPSEPISNSWTKPPGPMPAKASGRDWQRLNPAEPETFEEFFAKFGATHGISG